MLVENDRFEIHYRLKAESQQSATALAAAIALENTVEIPRDVVPHGYIEDLILGRVEGLEEHEDGTWLARLSYHIDGVGYEFPQLINVIFGNASIFEGVKVVDLVVNQDLIDRFPGAAFGTKGVRDLIGKPKGGYITPVLKPQGSTAKRLAELCYGFARAGADIIKEDHGLANQDKADFKSRVKALAQATKCGNQERHAAGDKTRALYFANVLCHGDQVCDRALYAQDQGADGILLIPGLLGFDALNRLRQNPDFHLPIMAHPSHLGPYVLSNDFGYSHGFLFGTLMRLSGADISVFPSHGGRFGFSKAHCDDIAQACKSDAGLGPSIIPSPGGGMTPDRLPQLMAQYGQDCAFLLGGSLLKLEERIESEISKMRQIIDQAETT